MAKPLVVIFARAPRYGAVKTRLARDIGSAEAIRFYRRTLFDLARRIGGDPRFETVVATTPDSAAQIHGIWPPQLRVARQGHGDLGRRMMRALRGAGARPAVVIGSDVPGITSRHLIVAFRSLGRAPFVLGPARDGGFWLIGARRPSCLRLETLDGVRWSSSTTMQETIERLGPVDVLPLVLEDVDDGETFRMVARMAR
ncbi:MAG: TIGR04282 family arsenosugar biosynthesis glycosyltransferase [Alphaproteobacteria bacterium]|nr:TIGR04282 family arsenosugar biosynthesis glycosyltransferase [Alphaproteobacteria bacterium]